MTLVYGLQDVAPFFVFSVANDCLPHTHTLQALVRISIYWSLGQTQNWLHAIHMDHTV